jgi:hypothetical protein
MPEAGCSSHHVGLKTTALPPATNPSQMVVTPTLRMVIFLANNQAMSTQFIYPRNGQHSFPIFCLVVRCVLPLVDVVARDTISVSAGLELYFNRVSMYVVIASNLLNQFQGHSFSYSLMHQLCLRFRTLLSCSIIISVPSGLNFQDVRTQ